MYNKIFYFYQVLNNKIKKQFYYLQILIFFNSILQLAVVFSVAPLVAVLSNNDQLIKKIYNIYDLSYLTKNEQVLFVSLFSFVVFISANLATAKIYIMQQKFCANISIFLSEMLFSKFINHDSKKKIQVHSSYYKSIIEHDITSFANKVVFPIIDLNSKIIPLITIIFSIFLINPLASIIIFSFLSSGYFLVYKFVKRKLNNNSLLVTNNNYQINKLLLDTFNSIIEVKIFGFQSYLIKKFNIKKTQLSNALSDNMILSNIPRFFFEILAFGTVLFFIFYQIHFTQNYNNTLTYTAIYITAGYKIMPYLQSILFGFSMVKGTAGSLNRIYSAIKEGTNKKSEISLNKIKKIELKNFSYSYNGFEVFKNSSVEFNSNQIIGIYGESGCGKTTLANIILGYLKINKGFIKVNNQIIDNNKFNLFNKASYVPQKINLLNENIIENITFKNNIKNNEKNILIDILHTAQLHKFVSKNKILKTKINENNKNISGGQAQRVAIARALYKKSDLIIFDEFTSNIDSETEKKIFYNLRTIFKEKIIIIITHNEKLKKYCSKIYKIKNHHLHEC